MSDNNTIRSDLLEALRLKYMAMIQSAVATMGIYLANPVGIGEHPQHLEEMDKLVEEMATNQDKLEALNRHFNC